MNVVRPPTGQKGRSRGRTVFEDVVPIQHKSSVCQCVEVGRLYVGVSKADISKSPVVYQDKDNVWFTGSLKACDCCTVDKVNTKHKK